MEVRELIQSLHDKRLNIRAQQSELMSQIEANLDGETGEDKAKWDAMDKEFADLGSRIDNLLTMQENDKELNEQRARFEKVVRDPKVVETAEHAVEERVRNWLKAGLPDTETWAPKSMTIKFSSLAANPDNTGRIDLERHDLTRGTATDGAELIPTGFVRTLQEHLVEANGVRRTNAQVFTTSSGENLLVPATTTHGVATLVAEAGAFLENDPQFKQVTMNAYKFGSLIQVSTELIQDSAIDLLSYLGRAVGISIGTATGAYNVTGTGSSQPEGIANAGVTGKLGTAPGASYIPTGNDLIDLYHSVVTGYRARGYWLMNDTSAARIRKLRDDTGGAGLGNFLWQPGMQAGAPDTLFGRPVITDPNITGTLAVNAFLIAFGDFSSYFAFRDVNTVQFDRSDDFAFSTGLVTFRSSLRTDSKQLINGTDSAVKWFKGAAT
jgi:HK97 family phage major capsid protein